MKQTIARIQDSQVSETIWYRRNGTIKINKQIGEMLTDLEKERESAKSLEIANIRLKIKIGENRLAIDSIKIAILKESIKDIAETI